MANATFASTTYTIPNTSKKVYVRYIKCNYNDITLKSINSSVRDSKECGINGTYFNYSNQCVVGIAINDGEVVRNYGSMNRDPKGSDENGPLKCGTFFKLKKAESGIVIGTADIDVYEGFTYDGIKLTTKNTQFAIGGSNLYPNENITEATFNSRMKAQNAGAPSVSAARSAIVYIGGENLGLNTVLVTVQGANNTSLSFNGQYAVNNDAVTLWQLRTLINTIFGPMLPNATSGSTVYHAIALDGGYSSQIAYKNPANGSYISYQATYNGDCNSSVYTMLSVPM